jgi:HK97 family phage major capsid protein
MIAQDNSSNIAALTAVSGATSGAPTLIVYQDLVNLYGSLDAAYIQNASWVMTSTTRASLMGLISTIGATNMARPSIPSSLNSHQ